jgi:hypothetical protein
MKYFIVITLLLLTACVTEVKGKYINPKFSKFYLELNDGNTYFTNTGYAGNYIVDGNQIELHNDRAGNAVGIIKGNKVTFPKPPEPLLPKELSLSKDMEGTWERKWWN